MAEKPFETVAGLPLIDVDLQATEEERKHIRQLELDEYQVCIPTPNGSGEMFDQLQCMAELMQELYNETQRLIEVSGNLIDEIMTKFKLADGICIMEENPFAGAK